MSKQHRTPKQIRDAANSPWPEPARTQAAQGILYGEVQRARATELETEEARRAFQDAIADIFDVDPEFAFAADPDFDLADLYEEDFDQDPVDPRDFETW